MRVIDADCHVIETSQTWEYMDATDAPYRPVPTGRSTDGLNRETWDIQGRPGPKNPGRTRVGSQSAQSGHAETTEATRTVVDVQARLSHMDELGVDVQVLYPTIFLGVISDIPAVELALTKSYNRWLGDIYARSGGRLRWVAIPPLGEVNKVPEELEAAKENGACGVFMRGFEGERLVTDPFFASLYEAAEALEMPLCFHAGCGNKAFNDLTGRETFTNAKFPVLSAFHSLIYRGIPQRYPRLRFGFVEVAANWLPYVLTDLDRRMIREGKPGVGQTPLADNNMFVACQTNDDLPHIMKYVGDTNLMIGSDYGHDDTSSELEALRNLGETGGLSPNSVSKILDDNPRRLYAI